MGRVSTGLLAAVVSVAAWLVMQYVVGPRLPVYAVDVPPLAGLSPEQARAILEPRGLLLVLDSERPDARVAPGTLSEQRPLGGSRVRRGDEIHATIARAHPPAHVPNLVGMTAEQARAALEQAHLKAGRSAEAPSDTVPRGQVSASSPAAGAEAGVDTPVDLTLSTGAATQPVPSVVGKSRARARQLLEKAGFAVGATRYGSNDDYEQGVVIGQNPAAGAQASAGVKIDLVIND
jgi:serine/threonine-protein kinase